MERLTFRLKVITPLFLSGADQAKAELRPPSIRGALRFWFRAMMGGVVGGDWRKVKQLETEVFGSTEQASRFAVAVSYSSTELHVFDPTHQIRHETRDGIIYLSFPRLKWDRKAGKQQWIKPHIEPNSTFTIELKLFDDSPHIKQILTSCVWLFLHFGGLGTRNRRGFGSLRSLSSPSGSNLNFQSPLNPRQLACYFKDNLQEIERCFCDYAKSKNVSGVSSIFNRVSKTAPSFSCFQSWESAFITKDNWQSWDLVLDDLGQFLRRFRNNSLPSGSLRARTPDYTQVVTHYLPTQTGAGWALHHGRVSSWDLQNDAFGLPIQYRSNSRSQQVSTQTQKFDIAAILKWKLGDQESDRRGSPLSIHPLALGNGQYAIVLLIFYAEFLPSGAAEQLQPVGRWPSTTSVPRPGPQAVLTADLQVLSNLAQQARKTFTDLGGLP